MLEFFVLLQFAADFAERTLLTAVMIQLLKAEEDGSWSVDKASDLVANQVLEVDKQLLKAARSSLPIEISGMN